MDDLNKAIASAGDFLVEIYKEKNIDKMVFEGFRQVEKKHNTNFIITLSFRERPHVPDGLTRPAGLYETVWRTRKFEVDDIDFEVLSMEND